MRLDRSAEPMGEPGRLDTDQKAIDYVRGEGRKEGVGNRNSYISANEIGAASNIQEKEQLGNDQRG